MYRTERTVTETYEIETLNTNGLTSHTTAILGDLILNEERHIITGSDITYIGRDMGICCA
jgi:hypothetical protein